jgi:hypothetical protein
MRLVEHVGRYLPACFFVSPDREKEVLKHMDSAMIGKIQKAKQYAQETDRILFNAFKVTIAGDHNSHAVLYDQGQWSCDCDFFLTRGVCTHTMTMERVLNGMLRPDWVAESDAN